MLFLDTARFLFSLQCLDSFTPPPRLHRPHRRHHSARLDGKFFNPPHSDYSVASRKLSFPLPFDCALTRCSCGIFQAVRSEFFFQVRALPQSLVSAEVCRVQVSGGSFIPCADAFWLSLRQPRPRSDKVTFLLSLAWLDSITCRCMRAVGFFPLGFFCLNRLCPRSASQNEASSFSGLLRPEGTSQILNLFDCFLASSVFHPRFRGRSSVTLRGCLRPSLEKTSLDGS